MKKRLFSVFALRTMFIKGFKNGSTFWRYGFYFSLIFKILKWLFSKPAPQKVDEFELHPGQYTINVTKNNKIRKDV